ncbi:MAG: DUF6516 family protein [Syntrophobacteraceae bacterium]|nr:DUF6516 family protein [Syntrophobacteraceae bacterium]
MNAELMLNERHIISENSFVEIVVWRLPVPAMGSVKYRLALVVESHCVLRYDNEHDKGDYRHVHGKEHPYIFTTPRVLLDDFWNDVDNWRF